MLQKLQLIVLTALSGACIPLGAALACIEHIRPNWLEKEFRHFVIAFGGGILLGAVSVVLVPEGIESMQQSIAAMPILLFGGVSFYVLEKFLGNRHWELPQFMGMLLDYIPETLALGGMIALGKIKVAALLAVLIGLQNMPEGFNAFREMEKQGVGSKRKILLLMSSLILIGPVAALCGYYFLMDRAMMLGAIMLFASGGILYLIFQDIAPQSKLQKHWLPPLGAVFGYSLALFSDMLVKSL